MYKMEINVSGQLHVFLFRWPPQEDARVRAHPHRAEARACSGCLAGGVGEIPEYRGARDARRELG
jgi:hypothetical protein